MVLLTYMFRGAIVEVVNATGNHANHYKIDTFRL